MTKQIQQRAADYYDDFSLRYDDEREKGYFGFINDMEFDIIKPFVEDKVVLEVGCGTGLILSRASQVARKAIGVDVSSGMVNICQKKGLEAQLLKDHRLPYPDHHFDISYAFKVLPHIQDVRKTIEEMARVTRPGGRVVLEFYNPFSFKGIADSLRVASSRHPIFLRQDSPHLLDGLLPSTLVPMAGYGIRIFGPLALFYEIPLFGRFLKHVDRVFSCGILSRLGGYYVLETKRRG